MCLNHGCAGHRNTYDSERRRCVGRSDLNSRRTPAEFWRKNRCQVGEVLAVSTAAERSRLLAAAAADNKSGDWRSVAIANGVSRSGTAYGSRGTAAEKEGCFAADIADMLSMPTDKLNMITGVDRLTGCCNLQQLTPATYFIVLRHSPENTCHTCERLKYRHVHLFNPEIYIDLFEFEFDFS